MADTNPHRVTDSRHYRAVPTLSVPSVTCAGKPARTRTTTGRAAGDDDRGPRGLGSYARAPPETARGRAFLSRKAPAAMNWFPHS
jgi:hypothetical protein